MKRYWKVIFMLMILGVLLAAMAFFAVETNAQNQSVEVLAQRLKQQGVPVRDVVVVSRVPFQIRITLQSASTDKTLTLDDTWFMQLSRREATLAFRIGLGVSSYELTVLNSKGDTIASEQKFLYPSDQSQQLIVPGQSKVDNTTTKKLITDRLKLAGMSLDKIEVISDTLSAGTGQILLIQLSVPDLTTANKSFLTFHDSLARTLATINSEQGTYLVLCQVRIVDKNGQVLLNYVNNLESGGEQWSQAPGFNDDWFPHPAPTSAPKPIPTPTPRPYP